MLIDDYLLTLIPSLDSLPSLAPDALAFVQSSLFDYFTREYVEGEAENGVACELLRRASNPIHD